MQQSTRKITALLFALVAIAVVAFDVYVSLNPDHYYFRTPEDRADWTYDPGGVAFVCAVILAEAAIVCLAIVARRPKFLWIRSFIALLLLGPWSIFSTLFVVHMPGYILLHHLWVWLLVLALIVVGAVSAIRHLYNRLNGRAA